MPTVREIAKEAGVSPATVSRFMTGSAKVNQNTEDRIRGAIERLQERKMTNTLSVRGKKVGIIIPTESIIEPHHHPALFTIINSFIGFLSEYGLDNTMLIYENTRKIEELFSPLHDGYLILGTGVEQEKKLSEYLGQNNIPYILINRQTHGHRLGRICFNDEEAVEGMVSHLILMGHKRIAYVGGNEDYENTQRRLSGYRKALKKAGLPLDDKLLFFGDYSEQSGEAIGNMIAQLRPRPTAACCCSDSIAAGCMRAIQSRNLSVPGDIAVTGFGDEDIYRYITPALTTIQQPSLQVGLVAGSMIIQLIEHPDIDSSSVLFQTKLILRESSGSALRE